MDKFKEIRTSKIKLITSGNAIRKMLPLVIDNTALMKGKYPLSILTDAVRLKSGTPLIVERALYYWGTLSKKEQEKCIRKVFYPDGKKREIWGEHGMSALIYDFYNEAFELANKVRK